MARQQEPQPPMPTATPILGNVGQFNSKTSSWQEYVEVLEHFLSLNNITEEDRKRALLLTSCGPETYHVIRGLVQPARPSDKTFEQLCALVQSHYSPKPSEIVERYKFHSRSRKPEESVSE